ncbi:glutathione S-transferase domain-containing protein [Ilyonectria sp. MPI-CAGE-AT-0026]|nr:glutathione S-transferase domain-containing protein [Ilyonectria sp. MPI-CAGE-AT-0026]
MAAPKIKLYTNHNCPFAHRAHTVLKELGIPYEEEIIDLSVPRTQEYLNINPRGLVPAISYDGEIITESVVVSQFLADAHPSHLVPASDSKEGALRRARINFFVDTYSTKVNSIFFKVFGHKSEEEAEELASGLVDVITKEIEPLLKDAAPYFGGSEKVTLAEALTASFVVRLISLSKYGVFPKSLVGSLSEKAPNFYRWAEVLIDTPSVNYIYNEEFIVEAMKKRIPRFKSP